MRFTVLVGKTFDPEMEPAVFFETDDLEGARAVAMRMAFNEGNQVQVWDTKYDEPVKDFDSPRHRS